MKHFKQLLLPALVLVLILSSCTVNHPLYTSNYHIEWKKFKYNNSKHTFSNNNAQNKINSESIATKAFVHEQTDSSLTLNDAINDNNIASTDRSMIILPAKKFDFNITKASTKRTNTALYENKIKAKKDAKKLSPLKINHRKMKGIYKALFIFLLALCLVAFIMTYLSLFSSFFLLMVVIGSIVILSFGTLLILGL